MGQLLTILALFAVCVVFAAKIIAANRRAARKRKQAEEERTLRASRENELRERVGRVKKQRDPLELSKKAIADDPAAAAKTLSRLMRAENDE